MTEFPIIFSTPMVLALLEGLKVLTRRLAWQVHGKPSIWQKIKAGTTLWVRESAELLEKGSMVAAPTRFVADGAPCKLLRTKVGTTSAIHLPRFASRIDLGVTMTRLEPLQEISELNAIAEGIQHRIPKGGYFAPGLAKPGRVDVIWPTPREAFSYLWETLHGADSWAQNPEVVVIGFQVLKRP